jgi:hypothetical protein
MRTWAYRSLVWLVAVAFVASGMVTQPCVAAQPQQSSALHATHHAGSASTESHQHHYADTSKPAPGQSQVDHGCLKCCGRCTFVSIVPLMFEASIAQAASYAAYPAMAADIHDWRGLLEPDIPKALI